MQENTFIIVAYFFTLKNKFKSYDKDTAKTTVGLFTTVHWGLNSSFENQQNIMVMVEKHKSMMKKRKGKLQKLEQRRPRDQRSTRNMQTAYN